MAETDEAKLFLKLNKAEAAIFNRQQSLSAAPTENEERNALDDAIRTLRVLKKERLNRG
jgi:hypothetical protein